MGLPSHCISAHIHNIFQANIPKLLAALRRASTMKAFVMCLRTGHLLGNGGEETDKVKTTVMLSDRGGGRRGVMAG